MLMASKEAIGLLFGCMYVYAFLGVMLFGGLIYDGNKDLEGTDYRDSNYEILNFNDMGLAMVSLFVNLITSFVPEFYEAGCAVFPIPAIASFFIDIFLALYEDRDEPDLATAELESAKAKDGEKVTAAYSGSDDIYQKLFLEKGSEEYEKVITIFKEH